MQSDLEVIREMYSAFSRADVASVLAALAPQVVWIEAEGFPSAGRYTTPDAVLHKVFISGSCAGVPWSTFSSSRIPLWCSEPCDERG